MTDPPRPPLSDLPAPEPLLPPPEDEPRDLVVHEVTGVQPLWGALVLVLFVVVVELVALLVLLAVKL